jgi:hypothetical protein
MWRADSQLGRVKRLKTLDDPGSPAAAPRARADAVHTVTLTTGSTRFNTATPGLPAALRAVGQAKIRNHKRQEQGWLLVVVDLGLP